MRANKKRIGTFSVGGFLDDFAVSLIVKVAVSKVAMTCPGKSLKNV